MRRASRRLGPWVALTLASACVFACGGDDTGADTEGATDESSDEGPPLPSFAEPASGRLSLTSTRTEDVSLGVLGIRPGVTELFIDDVPLGPLAEGSPFGRLDSNALRLFVRGSLVTSMHRMMLRTADATGINESELVVVQIGADTDRVPVASLEDEPVLTGDRVTTFGHGDGMLLVVHEASAPAPTVHLVPPGDGTWDVALARSVPVPGLAPLTDLGPLPIATERRELSSDDPGRIRVAWRVGEPGTRIDVLDVPWGELGAESVPSISMTTEDARAGRPAEWAELRRPWLVGDRLLAELHAPVDVESPRPGDRAVVHARVVGDAEDLETPQRLSVGPDLVDLDGLAPAIDAIAAERGLPAPITLRADRREPMVLELDPERDLLRTRPTQVAGAQLSPFVSELPLVTVTGAFGSRTVAGLQPTPEGALMVSFFDDILGTLESRPVEADALPEPSTVTGDLAPGSIDGLTVFLVPFGDAHPVHVLYAVGDQVEVVPLPELHCDAVAVASGGALGSLPLACARDGQVWLGSVGTQSTTE